MRRNSVGVALGKYVGEGRNTPHALDEILGKSNKPRPDRVVDPNEMENLIGHGTSIFTSGAITTARQHKRGLSMSGFQQNEEGQHGDVQGSIVDQKDAQAFPRMKRSMTPVDQRKGQPEGTIGYSKQKSV
jgi:hypothetical protein